jgi:hypothetical protein
MSDTKPMQERLKESITILKKVKEMGIHQPKDYKEKPEEYCGMTIRDNPYYDM